MSEIDKRVIEIISEHLGVEESKVSLESKFADDLGADSLDQVELVMAFEEAFNIEIPDEVAEKIIKVSDAIKYVREADKVN